jgi:hypothetical protein
VRFTFKAEGELLQDDLTKTEVYESILNAQSFYKVIRSKFPAVSGKRQKLYVIKSFSLENRLIYTKGRLMREGKEEVFYIMISSKIALEG